MLKRSVLLLIVLGVFAAAAIFGIQALQGHEQQADAARTEAFAAYNAEVASGTAEIEAQNARQVIGIIELEREGYGSSSKAELAGYVRHLQWAESQLPAGSPDRRQLERDISWCRKRLRGAK